MKNKKYANFSEELKLWKRGYRVVVGLDEAGRGPLAGPVTAAAVTVRQFPSSPSASRLRRAGNFQFSKIKDSKKLSPKKREEWYKLLKRHPDIKWGIGTVSEKIIDKINIFEATKLAMKKAIEDLKNKDSRNYDRNLLKPLSFLILDGNMKLDLVIPQKAIVKADEKVFSCAAASIIAKVTRDRIMRRYGKKYPQYGFEKHKGYGTKAHCQALKKHGPCRIHRFSFRPLRSGLPRNTTSAVARRRQFI